MFTVENLVNMPCNPRARLFFVKDIIAANEFTVPLTSKLTLTCGNTHVLLYFCQVTWSELSCDTRVNFHVEHASSISWTTQDPSLCAA